MGHICGLDLGQAQDPTCLVILEQTAGTHNLRFLERPPLGTSYPKIVDWLGGLLASADLAGAELVVDATGCGQAVVDMLRAAGLRPRPVLITGGDKWHCTDGVYRVPKRDLAAVVAVLLQDGRLRFAAGLPDLALLQQELLNFKVKIDPKTANDSYSAWREGLHDDMVLAVALACWWGERHGRRPDPIPGDGARAAALAFNNTPSLDGSGLDLVRDLETGVFSWRRARGV